MMKLIDRNWKEFNVRDIFVIGKGTRLEQKNIVKGEFPFISAKSIDNGIFAYIDIDKSINNKGNKMPLILKNKITIDVFGNCFFQNFNFSLSDNALYLDFENINEYNALFIITCFNFLKEKYSYGSQLRTFNFITEVIKLPVNQKDDIDYIFMEKYIKEKIKELTTVSLK